ncbi:hypothetical protein [Anoxybacillus flavithermus]|uniref:hypothetical protein n=1 Tax=Anoxybacillus flavithermus TaxID=33934 RepID=UPI001868C65B|nr:hypothetical protein [Anoxybacillus flavithermus]MBE2914085.1 hypothetical protein [Anoxybacillus flavithermus]
MKPGAKKLLEYLKSQKELKLSEIKTVGDFWTEKTIKRFVEEYSDVFIIENEKVKLKDIQTSQPQMDMSEYVKMRSIIHSELEKFLVGPFEENETLANSACHCSLIYRV